MTRARRGRRAAGRRLGDVDVRGAGAVRSGLSRAGGARAGAPPQLGKIRPPVGPPTPVGPRARRGRGRRCRGRPGRPGAVPRDAGRRAARARAPGPPGPRRDEEDDLLFGRVPPAAYPSSAAPARRSKTMHE